MASNDIRSKSNAAMNAYYYANQIGKVGKAIGKGYMGAGNFIANNNAAISAGFNLVPNPDTTLNTTELISGQVYDKASDMLMTNPYTALVGLGMKGAKKADLLSTATDFNDKDTGLNFFQHAGNFLTSLTPGSKLFSTKINPVDKSRLNGISSYTWYNDLDKYNNKGKAFYVTFGGKKMKEAADNYQLAVNTAVDISDEGARAMKFDPYQVAKKSEQELKGGFDSRYGLLPAGKQGTTLQFTKRTLSKYKVKKQQNGGQISIDSPIVRQKADGNFEITLQRTPTYEEWVKDVPEDYNNKNYDLELLYNRATLEKELGNPELWNQLQGWLWAITRPTPEERDFYGKMQIPDEHGQLYNPYHLGSVLEEWDENNEPTGNYIFLKLGTEEDNPEVHWETDLYRSGQSEISKTHNLEFKNGRYYYIAKNPEKFKEGGKVNVIPEGALHKNKHHLEDVDEKFEDVTKKGIPVIVESEGGEVIQQAEVERQEIIFRLKVTKKLEELAKEHTDKAAIEAGKLLVKEILYNTVDNTQEMI